MIKKVLTIGLISILFFSCSSYKSMFSVGKNIKKVELGMSKKQVVSIMGKDYKPVGAMMLPEGKGEILGYEDANLNMYKLRFLNDELVHWEYEQPCTHVHENKPN